MGKDYGQFRPNRNDPVLNTRLAHKLSWIFSFGEIPKGLQVLHTCDNPRCVNPLHLFLGTQNDNMKDMVKKGRHSRGSRNGMAKLNEDLVRSIYHDPRGRVELSQSYGVSLSVISNIKNRKVWKHLWSNHEN